jgi:hypothetical protein
MMSGDFKEFIMKFDNTLSEAGQQQAPAIDTQDMTDPVIAQLTQKKVNLQQQMAKQIEQIDKQIAARQKANNKSATNPQGGVPGM